MADVITRFKLETTQFDSKLRDAAKGLQEYTRVAEAGGKGFTNFSQKALESARALGQTASGATNLKDKVKDLVGAYNDAAKAYNKLSQEQQQSDFGKALADSISQLSSRIKEAKSELYGLADATNKVGSGGSLFGGGKFDGMLQVFGGNLLTKGFEMATSAALNFVSTIKDAAAQGIEMAKAGEGIRIAFDRLNRADLLDKLREATHGTVTDLELMKQAVKFNDFKLNLDEMGTLLAFAQQKAKDTGQSVDYMVDSIVTGLGRQSLMILDNLGLSAAEIKERMKETGDMTSAVASIIRDQMSQAGEYVETAADRATKADVELKNAMEDLGRTLLPLEQEGTQMFAALELGALKLLNDGLQPIIPALIDIKSTIGDIYDSLSNNTVLNGFINWLSTGLDITSRFVPYLRELRRLMDFSGSGDLGAGASVGASITGAISANAGTLPDVIIKGTRRTAGKGSTGSSANNEQALIDRIANQLATAQAKSNILVNQEFAAGKMGREMPSIYEMMLPEIKKQILDPKAFDLKKVLKEYVSDPDKDKRKQKDINETDKFASDFAKVTSSVSNIASGLQALGVEIPDGLAKTIGAIQTISGILTAILAITTAIQATSSVNATASVIDAVVPFARGGKVPKAANGYYVPGKRYSGDTTPILANAGELVLNKSSQGNLAAMIRNAESLVGMIDRYQNSFLSRTQYGNEAVNFSGGAMQNLRLSASISGEQIRLILKNNGRRTGRGEYVTSNFTRG